MSYYMSEIDLYNFFLLYVADIIYSTYPEKNAVCGQLGLCGFKGLRSEATCGDCTDGVNGVASLLVGREKVFEMIELLQVLLKQSFRYVS